MAGLEGCCRTVITNILSIDVQNKKTFRFITAHWTLVTAFMPKKCKNKLAGTCFCIVILSRREAAHTVSMRSRVQSKHIVPPPCWVFGH